MDFSYAVGSQGSAAICQRIVDHEHHDRANDRDEHAPNVQACDLRCSDQIKQETANKSAENSERDIEPKTLTLLIDDFAADETGNKTKNNPADDAPVCASFRRTRRFTAYDRQRNRI